MTKRILLIAAVLAAMSAAACANTVYMPSVDNLAPGWSISVVPDSAGRGSVTNRVNAGVNGFQFTQGDADKTGGCRAVLGTNMYDGFALSRITALRARVWYNEGDRNAQAPKFIIKLQRAPGNVSDRTIEWIPFSDGIAKQSGVWLTLDAMVDGSWFCPNNGQTYTTMDAVKAALPDALLTSSPTYFPLVTYSFNLGHNNWTSNVTTYNDNNRGAVDWFELGIDGVTTRYDLYDVPEPGSILALAAGLIGFIGLRRRA